MAPDLYAFPRLRRLFKTWYGCSRQDLLTIGGLLKPNVADNPIVAQFSLANGSRRGAKVRRCESPFEESRTRH